MVSTLTATILCTIHEFGLTTRILNNIVGFSKNNGKDCDLKLFVSNNANFFREDKILFQFDTSFFHLKSTSPSMLSACDTVSGLCSQ